MGRIVYDQEFIKTIVELLNTGKTVKELTIENGLSHKFVGFYNYSKILVSLKKEVFYTSNSSKVFYFGIERFSRSIVPLIIKIV